MTQRKQRLVAWMFSFSTECSPVKTAALINIAGESHGDHFHQTAKDSANPRAHAPSAQLLGLPARQTCKSSFANLIGRPVGFHRHQQAKLLVEVDQRRRAAIVGFEADRSEEHKASNPR